MFFEGNYHIGQEELTRYKQYNAALSTRLIQFASAMLGAYWGGDVLWKWMGGGTAQRVLGAFLGALLFVGVLVFLLYFTSALQSRRAVDSGQFVPYEQWMRIDHEGLHVRTNGEKETHVRLKEITMVRESASDFYIYRAKEAAWVVPKCGMKDMDEESAQLREVLKGFVSGDKLKLKMK